MSANFENRAGASQGDGSSVGPDAADERAADAVQAGEAPDPELERALEFPSLILVRHPLVRHKVTLLRNRATPTKIFKELVEEIAMLMAYEATADLSLASVDVETPLERARGVHVAGKKLTLVPILRAGRGLVEGILRLVPSARVGHIGLYRDHDTLEPVDYYFKVPGDAPEREFLLLDPMLATGGSAASAIASLKRAGAVRIRFLCLVAAPEGVARLLLEHPEIGREHVLTPVTIKSRMPSIACKLH